MARTNTPGEDVASFVPTAACAPEVPARRPVPSRDSLGNPSASDIRARSRPQERQPRGHSYDVHIACRGQRRFPRTRRYRSHLKGGPLCNVAFGTGIIQGSGLSNLYAGWCSVYEPAARSAGPDGPRGNLRRDAAMGTGLIRAARYSTRHSSTLDRSSGTAMI